VLTLNRSHHPSVWPLRSLEKRQSTSQLPAGFLPRQRPALLHQNRRYYDLHHLSSLLSPQSCLLITSLSARLVDGHQASRPELPRLLLFPPGRILQSNPRVCDRIAFAIAPDCRTATERKPRYEVRPLRCAIESWRSVLRRMRAGRGRLCNASTAPTAARPTRQLQRGNFPAESRLHPLPRRSIRFHG